MSEPQYPHAPGYKGRSDTGQRGTGALGGKVVVWHATNAEERALFAAHRTGRTEEGA
jgi:hypothetical protein